MNINISTDVHHQALDARLSIAVFQVLLNAT